MVGVARKKDVAAALHELWQLVKGRKKQRMEEGTADRSMAFAKRNLALAMSERWEKLSLMAENLAMVGVGLLELVVDKLPGFQMEYVWGARAKEEQPAHGPGRQSCTGWR